MTARKEAHLAMIQGVVSRLGQNSILLKGWSVLLVSALLVSGAASSEKMILLVALLPVLVFWGLDGHFLRLDRSFRALYDHVSELDERLVDYSMDVAVVRQQESAATWLSSTFSRSLAVFHGVVLLTVIAVYLVVAEVIS